MWGVGVRSRRGVVVWWLLDGSWCDWWIVLGWFVLLLWIVWMNERVDIDVFLAFSAALILFVQSRCRSVLEVVLALVSRFN